MNQITTHSLPQDLKISRKKFFFFQFKTLQKNNFEKEMLILLCFFFSFLAQVNEECNVMWLQDMANSLLEFK